MGFVMAYYFATFVVILITHETIFPVKGQCTVQGCDNGDPLSSLVAEIQQLRVDLFDQLNKQVQSIHELLNASFQDTVMRNLEVFARQRSQEHDIYIKQGQSIHEVLNASFEEIKSSVMTSLQEVDRRRSQEHDINIKQGQSIHALLNASYQEMRTQHNTVNMSLLSVGRRLLGHDICIKQVQSIRELFNESVQQTKTQHDTVINSLQEVDRRSQENNVYIKQVTNIHAFLNESFQEMKSQHGTVNMSLQAVDRRLENYQIDIKNQTQTSWKLVNDICGPSSQVWDCSDIKANGQNASGVYEVCVGHQPDRVCTNAFCDMKTANSTSLVFQRRKDGSVNFNRTWAEYKQGFGNPIGEIWLGNEMLHLLTSTRNYKLRVDLEDFHGNKSFAEYTRFSIGSLADNYRLTVGGYSGNAGDSLDYHSGRQFSTIDVDNDASRPNPTCAQQSGGGWWFRNCFLSSLNGKYYHQYAIVQYPGIKWRHWRGDHYSLKAAEMKLIPVA